MKKLGICLVLFIFVLGTSCLAQSNNDLRWLVGSWSSVDSGEDPIIFNSDGTCVGLVGSNRSNYFFTDSKLIVKTEGEVLILDYYLSSDGKILVIDDIWLEKQ